LPQSSAAGPGTPYRRSIKGGRFMSDIRDNGRRKVIKGGAALGASAIASPMFFTRNAWAQDFRNNPANKKSVVLGFNVPQTGAYADEGADELRAYKLAAKELNGEGDGG